MDMLVAFLKSLLILAALAALATVIIWPARRADARRNRFRKHALDQFARWLQSEAARQLALDSETETVQESETPARQQFGSEPGAYTLTRILRNDQGKYVLLKSTPGSGPYAQLISDASAKVVLKDRYRRPEEGT
jgi:type II secretory pathway pseudopilin PulG